MDMEARVSLRSSLVPRPHPLRGKGSGDFVVSCPAAPPTRGKERLVAIGAFPGPNTSQCLHIRLPLECMRKCVRARAGAI